jgi:hypothetical protein
MNSGGLFKILGGKDIPSSHNLGFFWEQWEVSQECFQLGPEGYPTRIEQFG